MCLVTRDLISGRLVPLLEARDDSGTTFLEALSAMPEEHKRRVRVELALRSGLLDLAAKYMLEKTPAIN